MAEDALLEELLSQWDRGRTEGREVPAAELCHGRPELLAELEQRMRQIRQLDRLIEGIGAADAGAASSSGRSDGEGSASTLDEQPRAAPAVPPAPAPPGYEILEELGRGGMGVVWKARQVRLDRVVAIKMIRGRLSEDPAAGARFEAEGRVIARLDHPGIVRVFDSGEHDGQPFVVMEFVPGGSLARKRNGTPREAASLVAQLADAVEHAHRHGIIHRDLKPANVLLAADGTPKVADFGLARRLDECGQTSSGAIMGTASYMAPEQAEGRGKEVGPAADVWSLGVMLYEWLAGRRPFERDSRPAVLHAICYDEPDRPGERRPGVPAGLEAICLRCLRKRPEERYTRAADLAEALRGWLAESASSSETTHATPSDKAAAGGKEVTSPDPAHEEQVSAAAALTIPQRNEPKLSPEGMRSPPRAGGHGSAVRFRRRVAVGVLLGALVPLVYFGVKWVITPPPPPDWHNIGGVAAVFFSPDGQRVITRSVVGGAADDVVSLWDIATGREQVSLEAHHVTPHPDGKTLVLVSRPDHALELYDIASGKKRRLSKKQADLRCLALRCDGETAALGYGGDHPTVKLWDLSNKKNEKELMSLPVMVDGRKPFPVQCIQFSPDRRTLAAAAWESGGDFNANPGWIKLWDLPTKKEKVTIPKVASPYNLAFSPDGKFLAYIGLDGCAQLWDMAANHPKPLPRAAPRCVAFSPDGETLALGGYRDTGGGALIGRVTLCYVRTCEENISWDTGGRCVECLAFSPDGKTLAVGMYNPGLTFWDVKTGTQVDPSRRTPPKR